MEYFVGFMASLLAFVVFNKTISRHVNYKIPVPMFTQSRKIQLIKNYLIDVYQPKPKKQTQSTKNENKNSIRAYFWDGNVYWIENGFLFTAKISNNKVDETTKKRVDTHALDKVELDRISFIVDKLAERNNNDNSDSGK